MSAGVNGQRDHRGRGCHVDADIQRPSVQTIAVELGIEGEDRIRLTVDGTEDNGASGCLRLRCAATKEGTTSDVAEASRTPGSDDYANRVGRGRGIDNDRLVSRRG